MVALSRGVCCCSASPYAYSLPSLFRTATVARIYPAFEPQKNPFSCLSLCADDEEGFSRDSLLVGEYGARIIVCEDDNEDFGEIKLECDESGCVVVMPKMKALRDENASGHLRCDLTGCYFTDEQPVANEFEVIKGPKWCLGYETAPESEESFSAVIGAGGWSIALTACEFNDFCQLIQTLRKGIATMDEDGFIGKDDISMQVEKGSVWMECTIPKKRVAILQNFWKLGNWGLLDNQQMSAFELRFVISGPGKRQAEGYWLAEAVMEMLRKIDALIEQAQPLVSSSI
ncbi:hypothetical protein GOP47_0002910 [Adiantum capillus-veneris]|uniref:Uncharacterized protein n=1 Tax=Adiantum capillus-veneris TaxID=13818 RepID=A0A9D4ZRR1_ADICA|nr:hypothetical protein GOP47_0002910 [Adiantum capillus-veneris]